MSIYIAHRRRKTSIVLLQVDCWCWRQHDVSEETAAIRGDADSDRVDKLTWYTRVILLSF